MPFKFTASAAFTNPSYLKIPHPHFTNHDTVVVHDPCSRCAHRALPQTMPGLALSYRFIPRPPEVVDLAQRLRQPYDAVIFSTPEDARPVRPPRLFSPSGQLILCDHEKLRVVREGEDGRLAHYHIPTDLPIVAQVSRFDQEGSDKRLKRSYRLARGGWPLSCCWATSPPTIRRARGFTSRC